MLGNLVKTIVKNTDEELDDIQNYEVPLKLLKSNTFGPEKSILCENRMNKQKVTPDVKPINISTVHKVKGLTTSRSLDKSEFTQKTKLDSKFNNALALLFNIKVNTKPVKETVQKSKNIFSGLIPNKRGKNIHSSINSNTSRNKRSTIKSH